jgi:hypothetical protein
VTADEFEKHVVSTQVEGLEFYVKKYDGLAELARTFGMSELADIIDSVRDQAAAALAKTRMLLATGAN